MSPTEGTVTATKRTTRAGMVTWVINLKGENKSRTNSTKSFDLTDYCNYITLSPKGGEGYWYHWLEDLLLPNQLVTGWCFDWYTEDRRPPPCRSTGSTVTSHPVRATARSAAQSSDSSFRRHVQNTSVRCLSSASPRSGSAGFWGCFSGGR